MPDGPGPLGEPRGSVVAIGGGHGLANALRAIRQYAASVTAVVTVADDGGSSGRLRRELGVLPPGDLRRALVALADPGRAWGATFEHRFEEGSLAGHALGNLVLAGLFETLGDPVAALDEAARLLGAGGRVLPATGAGGAEGRRRRLRGRGAGRGGPGTGPDPAGGGGSRRRARDP